MVTLFSASDYFYHEDGSTSPGAVAIITLGADEKPQCNYQTYNFELKDTEDVQLLKNDVFSKLVDRIAKKRSLLLTLYAQHHSQIVTRVQWAQGLSEALGMSLAWNRLEKELGVPEIGVDGNEDGPINYIEFLDRFRIDVELFWQNNLPASPNSVASSSTSVK
jgi:hypothetical protein